MENKFKQTTAQRFYRGFAAFFIGASMLFSSMSNAQNTFPSSGNVGIGTTSPGWPLDVQSTVYYAARFKNKTTSSTADGTILFDLENNAGHRWRTAVGGANNGLGLTQGQYYVEYGGQARLTLTRGGNLGVGIGNANASYKLDIGGRIRIRNGGGTAGLYLMNAANTSNRAFVGLSNDSYVGLYGSGGAGWGLVMNVTNGSVGIGTSSPSSSYKLSVNGSIRAKEVVVETGWADYVFEENYSLRTLTEVEEFIRENKHLPEVPSAKEVETNGVRLGEMESILLKKIEELTLYMIQQQKDIEALKVENAELRQNFLSKE